LFAAPAARRALVDGRSGAVELVLRRGAYLRFGDDWVALAGPGESFGPLSLAVDRFGELELTPGAQAGVGGGALTVGGASVTLRRMRERRMAPLSDGACSPGEAAVAGAAAAAGSALGAPPSPLQAGIDAIAIGSPGDAVDLLAGLGEGLTPAGDDMLAGYAACRAVAGEWDPPLSALAASRSSPLGLAYLRCAERGELPDAGARLIAAIRGGSAPGARAAVDGLREWGASSGRALGWGVVAAAGALLAPFRQRRRVSSSCRVLVDGTVPSSPSRRSQRR
jgi:hypothetical protein